MSKVRIVILLSTLVVFLYLVNNGIYGAEKQIEEGLPVYFELAPVDPRSLIQGDYMQLDYRIEQAAQNNGLRHTHRGQIIARLDENRVAHFVTRYDGRALAANEILINYHTRGGGDIIYVGVDSFFFQEGLGESYAAAKYAEVRVTSGGTVMLIDLVGEQFERLVPQKSST